ncbi:hypothetical protein E8E14_001370 [Neopestalotiopsis sp. 37M]|nr:hypothetical protein E8E14_001370 [Neopestalotiopsis sp. 37M]
MLEKFDIDYVLLEAHGEVAPPVGASIGLFPNGLRILDQIGCFEPIMALAHENLRVTYIRDGRGKVISTMRDTRGHMAKRHGYRILFFDRQWLLQVLYDQLKHKDRILLKKKVSKVESHLGGVRVTMANGEEITGDLVIGADGVHSTVRREMFRLGHELQPGYFEPNEPDNVPAYYKCSFGIAQNVPGWVQGEQHILTGQGTSQLVISGPEKRIYWFLFVKLPTPMYGKDIPKFSKDDEAQLVKDHVDLPITEHITFGQVYAHRLSSTLTALHEVVYEKWFFKRILILGDAAHKPNPIGGQGGNGAIESCAEFVNALVEKRDSRPQGLASLSEDDVSEVFSKTQAARFGRAKKIVDAAHKSQALNAFENPLVSKLVYAAAPFAGDEFALNRMGEILIGSTSIKKLAIPSRPRAIPFVDELPEKPISQRISNLVRLGFTGGMVGIAWLASKAFQTAIANKAQFSVPATFLEQRSSPKLQILNLVLQRISPLLIYTIEGYRIGNRGTLLSLSSLFTTGMQFLGLGCVAPIHAVVNAFQGYKQSPGRFIHPEVANALMPALTVASIIPTTAAFAQQSSVLGWKSCMIIWYLAPALFSALTWAFSKRIGSLQRQQDSSSDSKDEDLASEPAYFERYASKDVPILQRVYKYAFAVQATMHIATLVYSCSAGFPLAKTFGLPSFLTSISGVGQLDSQAGTYINLDRVLATVAIVASNLYTVWDLRQSGYVKTQEAGKAAVGIILGQALVGSSAAWAGLWYWREKVLFSLRR